MNSKHVSIAIDHGTTNSCMAYMDSGGPRVVKPTEYSEIMPSAVYFDRRGRMYVGEAAIKAMVSKSPDDGECHTGYKLRIGLDDRYLFAAANKTLRAPELGAIVIGELLKAYRQNHGCDPKACVITIPAKFEQSAVEGTREAARLAGLEYSPTIMEPIAAAMAYGFQSAQANEKWIVFDMGGGTLDVSLVVVRDGRLVVPEDGHAGDNRLGGRKFDRELLDYVLQRLSDEYDLDKFSEGSPKYRIPFRRLWLACEEAKIRLSRDEDTRVELDGVLCCDSRGRDVEVDIPITREKFQNLVASDIEKAVHICQMLIGRNSKSGAVARLILVGGPTKMPYLRAVLNERLRIPLDFAVDPMTAVALGAAVYADRVEKPSHLVPVTTHTADGFQIQLEYERESAAPVYSAAGKVAHSVALPPGCSIEVRRVDNLWASGRLPVLESGVFVVDLSLIQDVRPTLSRFETSLLDRSGKLLAAVAGPEIWHPAISAANRVANSLRVGVQDNASAVLIRRGADLPDGGVEGKGAFVTAKPIRKGSREDVLQIPVLESVTHLLGGEDPRANCSMHVGTMTIVGNDERITRDLPVGSEVVVTIRMDESRVITARAYVPLLEEEFEAVFKGESYQVTLEQIETRFANLRNLLLWKQQLQEQKPLADVAAALNQIQKMAVLEGIGKDLDRARGGDRDAECRAYKAVLEIDGTLDEIAGMQRRVRCERGIDALRGVVRGSEQDQLARIVANLSQASDDNALKAAERAVDDLEWDVRVRPWHDVVLDVDLISGKHVNQKVLALFKQAGELITAVDGKGGFRSAGEADLKEFERLHRELTNAYPDLAELRAKHFEALLVSRQPNVISTTLRQR